MTPRYLKYKKASFIRKLENMGLVNYGRDVWKTQCMKITVEVTTDFNYLFIWISPSTMVADGVWSSDNAIKRIQQMIEENLESCK